MKSTSLTAIGALLVFGIGGFMAGRISSPKEASGVDSSKDPTNTRSVRILRDGGADSEETGRISNRRSLAEAIAPKAGVQGANDRKARLEAIVRGENAIDRNRALLALIDQLGPEEFEEAVDHFRSLGITDSRFSEYAMLLTAWAEVNPTAALAYAKANTRTGYATGTILSAWASKDPDAAIRWAAANHQGEEANPYYAGIIRSLAATDPARATQLMTSMPRSVERGEALDAFLPHLQSKGGEATREWINGLTDEALKNGAMMRTAERLAEDDPQGTAAWLMSSQNEATQRRVDDVYRVWANKDESAAMLSMSALPAGENRSNALRGLVTNAASSDPEKAVSMMDRYPNDVSDRTVQHFIWYAFDENPSLAIDQVSRIGDEGSRDRMYRRTLDAWIDRDEANAMAWVQKHQLPQGVQDHVNRRLNANRQP